jgi:hypothetical protein
MELLTFYRYVNIVTKDNFNVFITWSFYRLTLLRFHTSFCDLRLSTKWPWHKYWVNSWKKTGNPGHGRFFLKRNDLWNAGRVQAGKKQNVFYWCLFSRHYDFPTHNSEWFAQMTCIISHWQLCKKTVPISDFKKNKQKYLILFTLLWHFYNRFTYTSWSLSRTRPYTWVI